jgi:hypothetical protein
MRSRCHQHAEFKVWSGRHIWLWFVADYNRKSGVIGAAATEAEAVSEARRSIEEMSAPCQSPVVRSCPINGLPSAERGWPESLARLERYLPWRIPDGAGDPAGVDRDRGRA